MSQEVMIAGAVFSDVPSIRVPDSNNVFHSFTDVTDTTATASDVASGKYFYAADGTKTAGTSSGGGGGELNVDTVTATPSSNTVTISFNGLKAEPKLFFVRNTSGFELNTSSNSSYVDGVLYDGTTVRGTSIQRYSTSKTYSLANSTGRTVTYLDGTLTINHNSSGSQGYFRKDIQYELVYVY